MSIRAWLGSFFVRPNPNLRFASLDMRGRLVIDVKGAVKAGVWDGEIAAARMLGRVLRSKAAKRRGDA